MASTGAGCNHKTILFKAGDQHYSRLQIMKTSSILLVSCQLENVPAITETYKMENQKLSLSFESLNSENDYNNDVKNRSRSVSPDITKFEEPGMFILLDEEMLVNRKGRQLRSSIRGNHSNRKAIDLPKVGVVILHQEDPKMKVKELNGEIKSSTMSETKGKDVAGNTKTKSHFPSPYHVTEIEEGKLRAFKEMLSASLIMIFF